MQSKQVSDGLHPIFADIITNFGCYPSKKSSKKQTKKTLPINGNKIKRS